ncbi:MAG: hypothetical protein AAF600_16745 [Bacteroidota bacterium]
MSKPLVSATSGNQTISESYYFTKSFTLTAASNYSVTMSSSDGDKFISSIPTNPAPLLDQNFVRVEVLRVPVSSEKELPLLSAEEKATTYSCFDGLHRKVMITVVQAGPNDKDVMQNKAINKR